ncbi:hypothetical protein NY08_2183 [Rhodococcus sp. B7740]|nr:hypothetical protein NY08_2183 [Rhodococcus sp. B7740]
MGKEHKVHAPVQHSRNENGSAEAEFDRGGALRSKQLVVLLS